MDGGVHGHPVASGLAAPVPDRRRESLRREFYWEWVFVRPHDGDDPADGSFEQSGSSHTVLNCSVELQFGGSLYHAAAGLGIGYDASMAVRPWPATVWLCLSTHSKLR